MQQAQFIYHYDPQKVLKIPCKTAKISKKKAKHRIEQFEKLMNLIIQKIDRSNLNLEILFPLMELMFPDGSDTFQANTEALVDDLNAHFHKIHPNAFDFANLRKEVFAHIDLLEKLGIILDRSENIDTKQLESQDYFIFPKDYEDIFQILK